MTKLLNTMKLLMIALMVSLTSASCQDKYPDLKDGLYAEIVTNHGTMVAKLHYDKVPVTVANFVGLAEGTHPKLADSLKGKPFYNGIIFHRVMNNFMIQGGDPTGTGMGSAGYKFYSEFDASLNHDNASVLSMANSGGLNTNGSQFFITETPYKRGNAFNDDGSLKNCGGRGVSCHAVFGELVIGIDVQDTISNLPVGGPSRTKPTEDVVMQQVNIIRKGSGAKAFDAAKVFTDQEPGLANKIKEIEAKQLELIKEKSKAAAQNFIKKNADMKGEVKELPTGLVMILNRKVNGLKPKASDRVNINCTGYLENGDFFYSTVAADAKKAGKFNEDADKRGAYKPFDMPYNESAKLVAGFREAMLNMNIGDKARVFIPSHLGYGASGNGPVPPNANIVFDLELTGIKK